MLLNDQYTLDRAWTGFPFPPQNKPTFADLIDDLANRGNDQGGQGSNDPPSRLDRSSTAYRQGLRRTATLITLIDELSHKAADDDDDDDEEPVRQAVLEERYKRA